MSETVFEFDEGFVSLTVTCSDYQEGEKMINSFTGEYYFLSNFYMAPVSYNGWDYTNNEAAFQAQKQKSQTKISVILSSQPIRSKGSRQKELI